MGYPFMIDSDGWVQVHPKREMIAQVNLAEIKAMAAVTQRMLDAETESGVFTYQGEPHIAGFAPIPASGWSIGSSQSVRHCRQQQVYATRC